MSNFKWGHEAEATDKAGKRIEQAIAVIAMLLVAVCIAATGLMLWQKSSTSRAGYIDSPTELAIFKELRMQHSACQAGKTIQSVGCGETNRRFEEIQQSMKNWKESAK